MIKLIPAELRRQIGRRGSFFGSMGFALLFAVILGIWAATTHSVPSSGQIVVNGAGLLTAITVIASVVLGAIAGAYDTDQGTMRYLVLTGRPRWQLVFVRYLAMIGTVILFTLPALILVLIVAVLFGNSAGQPPSVLDTHGWAPVPGLFWSVWTSGILYGVLALSIGTFLKSNAVAIAVAIVLNFAGVLAAGLLWHYVSHTVGNLFYPIVVGAVVTHATSSAGPDPNSAGITLGTSIAVLACWLVALLGLAWWRVQRAEY